MIMWAAHQGAPAHGPSYTTDETAWPALPAEAAILILKTEPIFCRLSVGEYGLHINESDRKPSILDEIAGNCLMTNCCRHLSRSPFAQQRAKIRIAVTTEEARIKLKKLYPSF